MNCPSLSRSSTLCSINNAELESLPEEPIDSFHKSFIQKYCPSSSFHDVELQEVPEPTGAKPLSWSRCLSDLCVNWWLWELFSWSISAVCMCTIALVLALYDDRRLPKNWPLGITLNAYISVLSALAKYALAVPVDEALGQLKYLWFQDEPKRLIDFERFDDATRGPWGSFALLVHTRGKSLASIGATITLLSLALDPFFQQIITYPERPSSLKTSSVPRAVHFQATDQYYWQDGARMIKADATMDMAIDPFFFGNASAAPAIIPFCPSGDCTWPPFQTLGVCSACEDVGDLLQFVCLPDSGDWRYNQQSLSNSSVALTNSSTLVPTTSCGYFLNASSELPMMMSGYGLDKDTSSPRDALLMRSLGLSHRLRQATDYFGGSIHFKHVNSPIVDFIVVSASSGAAVYANKTPTATECVLQWCIKTLEASYSQGQYKENVTSVYTDTSSPEVRDPFEAYLREGQLAFKYTQNVTLNSPEDNETFWVQNTTQMQNVVMFHSYFPDYLTMDNASSLPAISYFNDYPKGLANPQQIKNFTITNWLPPNNISSLVAKMATSMTQVVRLYPGCTDEVHGFGSLETYIHIRWGWFTLPLIMLALTLWFLGHTIWKCQSRTDIGIWKNSSIAALAWNGVDITTRQNLFSAWKLRDMFESARDTEVSLMLRKEK